MKYRFIFRLDNQWWIHVPIGSMKNRQAFGPFSTLKDAVALRNNIMKKDQFKVKKGKFLKVGTPKSVQAMFDKYGEEAVWSTDLDILETFGVVGEPEVVEEPESVASVDPLGILIGGVDLSVPSDEAKAALSMDDRDKVTRSRAAQTLQCDPVDRIMLFADMHVPYHHPDAIDFLEAVAEKFSPEMFINLGDEIDSHALSFYPMHPNLANATLELKMAREALGAIDSRVIKSTPCYSVESNHTSRMYRKAKAAGIPKELILPFEDALGVDWKWSKDIVVPLPNGTDLFCTHHKGSNTLAASQSIMSNMIAGHYHKRGGTMWWSNTKCQLFFASSCPCLIDFESPAYSYDENAMVRPNLGCMVVIDSIPHHIMMNVDENNRWDKKIWGN